LIFDNISRILRSFYCQSGWRPKIKKADRTRQWPNTKRPWKGW